MFILCVKVSKMGVKTGFLLITLLAASYAVPAPEPTESVDSDLFYHTDTSARIVGGTEAPVGSAPYMVALSSGLMVRSFLCGGSVISARTVLTAAHCIDAVFSFGSLSSTLRGTVGTNRWNSGGVSYAFSRNVTHLHYVSSIIKNDIGILVTSSNIATTNLVSPIALSFDFVGGSVVSRAAGWGRIRQGGPLSATLLELIVTTIDGARCEVEVPIAAAAANLRPPPVDRNLEICTVHSPDHGMCNGDSGSALVRVDRWQQIGIVSWGIPCARGAPDMFVRVSAYQSWLNQHVV